jgi:uncharacterized protein YndB with AHSA1/START domain
MSSPPPGQGIEAPVDALARPPIRQSTLVRSSLIHTFGTFVRTIGIWWPVRPFSAGKDRVRDVTLEQRAAGQVYETWDDGTIVKWGDVLVWEPPARFVMSWYMTPDVTEVELAFTSLGPNLTRVALEHRGWERLSDAQLSEDCALPNGYAGGAFAEGWIRILACLVARAEGTMKGIEP